MTRPREDQFVGALMGCAVGDALGAPLEGRPREQIAAIQGITDGFRPFRHKKDVEFPPGQYTDDTQLTLAIVKSLLTCGRVNPADIAAEFVKLWESNEIVGAGQVAHRAVNRLREGIRWEDAAAADDLPWNGAAMRIAPVGLWHFDNADQLARDVELASFVTHRHPLAVDGAIAVATAVAYAATSNEVETASFLDAVHGSIAGRSPGFADRVRELHEWLALTETAALEAIVADQGRAKGRGFGVPVRVEPTVLASLYVFLKSPGDYLATVDRALRAGGDVDTVAAIAGAISGAHNGLDAIPANLVAGVKDSAEILDLGARLFARRFADIA
ncbi:MAG: ADP-ribosylglycohydrolase family protein [Gammaproteobacteria bacterium]|nr:ADP-ribosylglycohydrolase family protein [Gammaproteobacteria bacterium]